MTTTASRARTTTPATRSRRRFQPSRLALYAVLVVAAATYLVPIYVMINVALKPPGNGQSVLTPAFPPTFSNFVRAWTESNLGAAMWNSVASTTIATTLIVVTGSLAAYPLARSTARWSRWTFGAFVFGLMIPFQVAMIPLFLTFRDMGLLGNLWSVIISQIGVNLPFAVFMFTTFLRNADHEYEEAAALDGCGTLRTYWHVVLPLMRPVVGTVAILCAIQAWNSFMIPLLYLVGESQTVPLALYNFVGEFSTRWNLVFAALIIGILPILLVYVFMQNRIIRGFSGGLKG